MSVGRRGAALSLAIILLVLALVLWQRIVGARPGQLFSVSLDESSSEAEADGQWTYLTDLPWISATTGWVAVAHDTLPSIDRAFQGAPLRLSGTEYHKGLGVYPLSEIVYRLDGGYDVFASDLGLNDLPVGVLDEGPGGVVFTIYLDKALAFDSGVIRRGQLPTPLQLPVAGVRELRLVVSASGPPSPYNFADWAEARLSRPAEPVTELQITATLSKLRDQVAERDRQREEDRQAIAGLASLELRKATGPLASRVTVEQTAETLVLRNDKLMLDYAYGGQSHALLTVETLPRGNLILHRAESSVVLAPELRLSLHHDTRADGFNIADVDDPVFGSGKRIEVRLVSSDSRTRLTDKLTLFDGSAYFLRQITIDQSPVAPTNARIAHFEALAPSSLAIGGGLRYLTDISRLRTAIVPDDGVRHSETVDQGKPVFLSSEETGQGLLVAAIDETSGPIDFAVQVDPGRVMGRLDFSTGPARAPTGLAGPRLYVEVTEFTEPRAAFQHFRRFFGQLYPPMPLPAWVRFQWLSWYTYYMDIDETRLRSQIDYIAENLGDLGPWHIIVDAGWYVAEGRPGADWRNVDHDKFPSGLRALVDYAHDRNVKVVLYFSAPYLDSRQQRGDWLGLRDIIEKHPDWLIPLGTDGNEESFAYDFDNPGLRSYLSQVMHDYFVTYDVDGIKLDGLGNAEGAVLTPGERDAFGLVGKVTQPALNIYRFVNEQARALKSDVYIESGWLTPLFANGLAHTFRYGDESATFSERYPQPGLVEHVDYATAQATLWGQRANMGALKENPPNEGDINQQWLGAAIALGAQTALSFDLTTMTEDSLSRFRSLLMNYRPFEGATHYSQTEGVNSFATTVGGLSYLGILNRGTARDVNLRLSDYGLPPNDVFHYYDVASEKFGLTQGQLQVKLGARSFRLFVLRPDPGVIWTNSSFRVEASAAGLLTIVAAGPASLEGTMAVSVPAPISVQLDGSSLVPHPEAAESSYGYDHATGILTLRYAQSQPRRIEIRY